MPELSVTQERSIALSNARINLWEGSTRGGKTVSSLLRWLIYVAQAPAGELAMFGRTRDTLGRNSLLQLQNAELFGDVARHVHYTLGSPTAHILGRRVHIFGANDINAEAKIRGGTFAGCYGDELTLIPQAFFTQALGRLSVPGSKMFGTTNPGPSAHWLRTEFMLRAAVEGMDLQQFHFLLDDNPSLTAEFKAGIRAEYTGLFFRRFVLGEWVNAEGSVFDMFDADRHVVDVCPHITKWICTSIDYGTRNPFCALVLGLGSDRRLYVVAEWYYDSAKHHRQLTDAEYSLKLREFLAGVKMPATQLYGISPKYVVVDPSAASFRQQLWTDHMPVMAADNSVVDGIRLVSSLLSSGRLLVHRSCVSTIEQLQSYSWDETAAGKGEDKPVKADDHAVDALRYACQSTRAMWRSLIVPAETPRPRELTFASAR